MEPEVRQFRGIAPLGAGLRRPRGDPLEVRGLLSGDQDAGAPGAEACREGAEEVHAVLVDRSAAGQDRVAVLFPPKAPVDHRSHGVEPQPIDMEAVDPMLRSAEEVRANLGLAIVEARGAPTWQLAQVAVVLELRRPAVAHQAPGVLGEVGPDEVHENRDVMPVQGVYQVAEVVRRPQAAVHGVKACSALVAPRLLTRILRQRQELDGAESHLLDMLGQGLGQFSVPQRLAVGHRRGPTGEVHFVD
mmetsp:Transcript_28912/g.83851  ORF Transcript_28912/g.83851 Transcript_28912/m.83851 type:complete len:246 (+) Transcript_28912:1218-1955(+)